MLRKLIAYVVLISLFLGAGLCAGPVVRAGYDRLFPEPPFVRGNYSAIYHQAGKPVVMFSTTHCPFCRQTRDLFNRERIDYREYKINESAEAKRWFTELDGGGVPLLFIGDRRIVGFRENVIRESLAAVKK